MISGIVSLTLTPMLCARMIKSAKEEHAKRHNWFYRVSERGFDATQRGYESSLRWSLRHRRFIFVLFLASIAATVQLFRVMPQDFLPSEDFEPDQRHHRRRQRHFVRGDAAPPGRGREDLRRRPQYRGRTRAR